MNNLPQGWELKTLGEVLSNDKHSMKRGPFGSSLKKEFFVDSGIRVFEQYNPINQDSNWKRYFITQEKFKELDAFKAGAGDLLISCSGTLGKILELPKNVEFGIINQALLKIRLDNRQILNSYFIYLFNSPYMQNIILENTIGSAIQNIASVKVLKQIQIPLPPLKMQKQIVQKLEKAFAHIDKASNHLQAVKTDIPRLKAFLLKDAFSGKLTKSNAQTWELKTLGEVVSTTSGGTPSRKSVEYWNGDIKWLKSGELNDGYIKDSEESITQDGLNNSSAKIFQKGTLLIALYGATIGKLGILDIDLSTNQAICGITPLQKDHLEIKYLFYYLFSLRKKMLQDAFGGAQTNISQSYLRELPIPLPPIQTQKQIVEILEKKFSHLEKLSDFVENSLQDLNKLKSSLLNQAFKGELVC